MSAIVSPPTLNPANLLRQNAAKFPDKPALFYPKGVKNGKVRYQQLTYRQIEDESDKAAYALRQRGFRPGDKTVFMVKPGPELFIQVFALFKVGAIPVVVDPGMGIKRMLHCYKRVGTEGFMGTPIATLVRLIARSMFSKIRTSVTVLGGRIWRQKSLLRGIDISRPYPIHQADCQTPALISFTTGSTGPAKAAECTQQMAHSIMDAMKEQSNLSDKDVQLLTLPFFGVIGMMVGNTCILPQMNPTKPAAINPHYLVQAINHYQVTCMFGSPSLINALGNHCKKESIQLASLRMVSCGGAPMTLDIMRTFRSVLREDAVFETTWGATEGLPLTSVSIDVLLGEAKPQMDAGKGVCIGAPVADVEVKAIKVTEEPIECWSDALEVTVGEVGELIVRGPNVSPRYHNDPANNKIHKIPTSRGNWHRTGDLGWFDENGRVWFSGRRSHQITLSNPSVTLSSVQSEGVTNNHPNVYRSALVCAFAGDKQSQTAVMCIELKPDTNECEIPRIEEELLDMMKHFASTQPVKCVLFHPSFPVDIRHNAKIERHVLGRWATQQLGKKA